MNAKNYNSIDVAKFLLSFLVVSIHIAILPSNKEISNFFTLCLARIAVPFFFICSGYLFFSKENQNLQSLLKVVKRVGILFIGWTSVFMIVLFFTKFIHEENPAFAFFQACIRFFLLNPFAHLWYLPAVIIGICIAWFFKKNKWIKSIGVFATILYILGLLGDSYYNLTTKSGTGIRIYEFYYAHFSTMRNGIFFGFPLICLSLIPNSFAKRTNALLSIVFLALIIVEYSIIRTFNLAKDYNLYISLPFFTYFFFHWVKNIILNIPIHWSKFFREYSMGIYFIHMAYILTLPESIRNYYTVVLLSLLTIWIVKRLKIPILNNLLK